ncbi:MAG: zinc-ribbon domain-containing protein [Candidatus Hodarchaeales archaeon]|jgi:hypothetical protein
MKYCTNCGVQVLEDDVFCLNCGEQTKTSSIQKEPAYQHPFPRNEIPQRQPVSSYTPRRSYGVNPEQYYPSYTGDCLIVDRCLAACVDSCIVSIGSCFFYFPGICYSFFKDGIRGGRSFGKSMMNLRVVKYASGEPAGLGDSCIRNCCNCCVCVAFLEKDQRHVGDLIAGTVVIRDH